MLRKKLPHRQLFTGDRRNIDQLAASIQKDSFSLLCFVLLCAFSWLKNSSCNLVTASLTRSSSITNVKLILDAPCEISDTLISLIVLNTRAGNARRPAQAFTNNTDDRSSLFDSRRCRVVQLLDDRRQRTRLIQRKRDADFRRRNHINHRPMSFKHFKQRAQKTVSAQHPRGSDLNDRHTCFMRDRFDSSRRRFAFWSNERAALLRHARIADADGNRILNRGLNSFRMQNFRAEVSKLGGFAVRQTIDCLRMRNYSRIGSQHAGHVSPDLYLIDVECGANQRRGVIRAAASERRRHALQRRTDKSTQHRHDSAFHKRAQFVLCALERFRATTAPRRYARHP